MTKRSSTVYEKQRSENKRYRKFKRAVNKWRTLVLVLFVSSFFFACTNNEEKTIPTVFEGIVDAPQTVEVMRGDIIQSTFREAQIIPEVTQLGFDTYGTFDKYMVSVGEYVTKGQILARADDLSFEEDAKYWLTEMERQALDYTYNSETIKNQMEIIALQMERVYEQIKSTVDMETYSSLCLNVGTLDQAYKRKELELSQLQELYELEYGFSKSKWQSAIDNIGTNSIVAPFSGTILATFSMKPGSGINPNDFYVAIAKEGTFCMQTSYVTSKTMDTKELAIGFFDGKEYSVSYVPIEEEVLLLMQNNKEEVYSSFRIDEPDELMQYGDLATIQLITKIYPQVLYIPEMAVHTDYQGKYVFVKRENEKVKVYITVGVSDGISIEVENGLEEGEILYVEN